MKSTLSRSIVVGVLIWTMTLGLIVGIDMGRTSDRLGDIEERVVTIDREIADQLADHDELLAHLDETLQRLVADQQSEERPVETPRESRTPVTYNPVTTTTAAAASECPVSDVAPHGECGAADHTVCQESPYGTESEPCA